MLSLCVYSLIPPPNRNPTYDSMPASACLSVLFLCLPEKPVPILCLCYLSIYLSTYLLTYVLTIFAYSLIHLFFFGTERIDDGGLFVYQYCLGMEVHEIRNPNVTSFELMNIWISVLSAVECPRQISRVVPSQF
jgi:hypothetical protein